MVQVREALGGARGAQGLAGAGTRKTLNSWNNQFTKSDRLVGQISTYVQL